MQSYPSGTSGLRLGTNDKATGELNSAIQADLPRLKTSNFINVQEAIFINVREVIFITVREASSTESHFGNNEIISFLPPDGVFELVESWLSSA